MRACVRLKGAPVFYRLLPLLALRRELTAFQVVEGSIVRRDQACLGAHLDRHIAQRHATFHAQSFDSRTAELDHMAGAACAAGFADDRQHDILRGDARRGVAQHFDFHGLRATLLQRLGRKNMLDFRGADAESQRTERAVRGSVRIAADDGHARQRHALLWPDDVHDALKRVIQIVELHAELGAVLHQLLHLDARHLAGGVDIFGLGRNVMVHGGERLRRLTHLAAVGAQTVESLRRRHLMDQVTIDIEQRRLVRRFVNDMCIK